MARNALLLNRYSPPASRAKRSELARKAARRKINARKKQLRLRRTPALVMLEDKSDKSKPDDEEEVKPKGPFWTNSAIGKAFGLLYASKPEKWLLSPIWTVMPYMGIFGFDLAHTLFAGIIGDLVSSYLSIIPTGQKVCYSHFVVLSAGRSTKKKHSPFYRTIWWPHGFIYAMNLVGRSLK